MNGREPQPRQSGRHRRGTVTEQVGSQPWDPAERAAAEQLDQVEPAWTVWYGPGTRRFHAVAVWPTPVPLSVRARTADELRTLMREAEHSTPPPQGGTMPETPDTPHPPNHPQPPHDPHPLTPSQTGDHPQTSYDPHPPDDPRTVCWDLPHDLPIVGKARAMVRETLVAWALHQLVDDVVLVIGELLANAIIHGEPVVRLSLWADADEFQVQVTDRGPGQPRHLTLDPESLHGRGLTIVKALAHDTGVTPLPHRPGKTVWARWRLPRQTAATRASS
ncbi:ATP-binding protein [Streptosporangium sp. NBC_01755]|uniref:ATP-binding protein n=1 Tax=Streptosporangium sp. NBC_01755 TaxID=2975949 RepID=UPI002DDB7CB8|nr:ATP-binding protein [Streptosporangium sp. NBC_01755]WSD02108.1 ATP-binding protein [Streptosporangium sp. NBC_01755]